MLKNVLFTAIIALGFISCENSSNDSHLLIHQDGRAKPKLIVLNVLDHSDSSIPWDLSLELSDQLTHQLKNYGSLYISNTENIDDITDVSELSKKLQRSPFNVDLKLSDCEFLTSVELIEHRIHPIPQKTNIAHPNAQTHQLLIKARIKVFDVRKTNPEIILSEIITHEALIPWQLSTINYKKNHYLTTQYKITPLGINHKILIQNIAKKVHDYVLLAKIR